MATRRDQLQAQRFLAQRVHSALVIRETDPEQPPFRRPASAAFGSIALALVVLIAFAVYGFLAPGGNRAWRTGDVVIVEKETGARYIYVGERLHPVLNYTSALLALGRSARTVTVSRESLIGVPRGPRIGIPDAPDALPKADRLLAAGWTLCSQPTAVADESILLVGTDPVGARPVGETALLVEVASTGARYMIWHGHRHRVASALRAEARTRVVQALIDILPEGEAIAPLKVRVPGRPSTAVPTRSALLEGQLVVAQTPAGARHYLVEKDSLRPITELQYDIQLVAPVTAKAYPGVEPVGIAIGPAAVAQARTLTPPSSGAASPPSSLPPLTAATPVCATYDDNATVPAVRVGGTLPTTAVPTEGRTAAGLPLADRIYVPPGRAALVESMPSGDARAGTLTLVTDQGRAHPLEGREILPILGYPKARPVRLPASVVTRVPQASPLTASAARVPTSPDVSR